MPARQAYVVGYWGDNFCDGDIPECAVYDNETGRFVGPGVLQTLSPADLAVRRVYEDIDSDE